MVILARYIVDVVDANGDVVHSNTFKTQREVVAAFPETFTTSTVREAFRDLMPRVDYGPNCKMKKYRTHQLYRYPK